MIGLINVVKTCCHAPARSGGVLRAVVFVLVGLLVLGLGAGAVQAIGATGGSLAAADAAVGAAMRIVFSVLGIAAAVAVFGWALWYAIDVERGRRARTAFAEHNRNLDVAVERRRRKALATGRQDRQAVDGGAERVRVASVRVDELAQGHGVPAAAVRERGRR